MSVPRGLAKRIDDLEKSIRLKLPEKPTAEEVRHEVRSQLAEEKFNELIVRWESEYDEILNGHDTRALTDAVDDLITRIKREPIMKTDAWGPNIREMTPDQPEGRVNTLADIYTIFVRNFRDSELRRIRMESRDSEGWEPMRL